MPNANELLSRVAGGEFITKIDLASAFFEVELETNSQKYTGFQTTFGTFSHLRMPQGLKAAPSTCQRLTDFVLRGTHKYAGTFTDDTAAIAYPLTETLQHGKPYKNVWGEAQQHAFESLQRAPISKPVLRPPDPSKDYIIFADASTVALSAILMQKDEEKGTHYVVYYASR